MDFLLLVLVLLLYSKWIVFVLCLPIIRLVRIHNKRAKIQAKTFSQTQQFVGGKKKDCMCVVKKYINGYLRYADFQTGIIPSHHIRDFLYRHIWLVDLAPKAIIYWGAEIRGSEQLHIGEGSIIGDKAILDARRGGIFIGKNVNFSTESMGWS